PLEAHRERVPPLGEGVLHRALPEHRRERVDRVVEDPPVPERDLRSAVVRAREPLERDADVPPPEVRIPEQEADTRPVLGVVAEPEAEVPRRRFLDPDPDLLERRILAR